MKNGKNYVCFHIPKKMVKFEAFLKGINLSANFFVLKSDCTFPIVIFFSRKKSENK